jgi:hypothetical protein
MCRSGPNSRAVSPLAVDVFEKSGDTLDASLEVRSKTLESNKKKHKSKHPLLRGLQNPPPVRSLLNISSQFGRQMKDVAFKKDPKTFLGAKHKSDLQEHRHSVGGTCGISAFPRCDSADSVASDPGVVFHQKVAQKMGASKPKTSKLAVSSSSSRGCASASSSPKRDSNKDQSPGVRVARDEAFWRLMAAGESPHRQFSKKDGVVENGLQNSACARGDICGSDEESPKPSLNTDDASEKQKDKRQTKDKTRKS